MRCIEWWHFQWPWRTPNPVFKVTAFLKSNIWKTVHLRHKVSIEHNSKPYKVYRIVPVSMTLSDLWPQFQGHDIFWISEKRSVLTVLKTKLLLHKRKLYLTYGMDWWPWLTSKRVTRVCQHKLSFLSIYRRVEDVVRRRRYCDHFVSDFRFNCERSGAQPHSISKFWH